MPLVANLTRHDTGLKSWRESDSSARREGKRKDDTAINAMIPWRAYGQMTDTGIKALWAYPQTIADDSFLSM